jgi:hypothetical protein
MPELLEESIAEIKEQSACVADTGEAPESTITDETKAEPVSEYLESTAESSDRLETPALSDSGGENIVFDESVADLEEPIAVLEEPIAVLEEPSAAVQEETGALDDEPGAEQSAFEPTSEALELADEPIEIPAIEEEEVAVVLAAPIEEAADHCSVDSVAEEHVVPNQMTEIQDQAAPVDEADASV